MDTMGRRRRRLADLFALTQLTHCLLLHICVHQIALHFLTCWLVTPHFAVHGAANQQIAAVHAVITLQEVSNESSLDVETLKGPTHLYNPCHSLREVILEDDLP